MTLNKLIGLAAVLLFLNTQLKAATLTDDCLAQYVKETGELEIPCLIYRELELLSPPHDKFLNVKFKQVPSSTPGVLRFELSGFEDSHIQEDDIIPNYGSIPPIKSIKLNK